MLKLIVLGVALAAAQPSAAQIKTVTPEDAGMSSAALERIAPAMQAIVDSNRVAGIAMLVARHGKIVYTGAVGTMDSARTVPMRMDAVFRIYSMTKPVTTVAVMQLYERGKLKLDDPVSKYIPEFANARVYASGPAASPTLVAPERPVTITDLLTHTAGLTYGVFGNTPVDSIYRQANVLDDRQTIEQMAKKVAALPLAFSPGAKWNYSVALDVLGRVVEVASGMTFDKYLAKEVFEPLRMRETAFHATPAMNGRITWLFAPARGRIQAAPTLLSAGYRDSGLAFLGGQGLLSTIPDYFRFTQALLNGGELDGKRILKRETVALMMQNHLPPTIPRAAGQGNGFGYGGSVRLDSTAANMAKPGTFRWSGYASTFFWIDPKTDLIGMVWAQVLPSVGGLETPFERLVYAAVANN